MVVEREPSKDCTDADLARRAATGGDRAAEAELCRRFAPRIRLYGLKHLRDEDRARDLVEAVLVTVIESLRAGRVEDLERIDRFMLGTARNLTARRRQQDARATPTEPADLDIASVLPARDTLDIAALMACIAGLELRARTVLQMSFFRDEPSDRIAASLDTTAANVRVVRHRAIAQLRDCLAVREAA
jgi:RNA polymerase sigma-70 factor (ECF subfamily)